MNIYPYFIYVQNPAAEEAQQNNEGDFVPSVEGSWNFYQNGRDEINSSGKKIAMTNGENIEYHAIIYAKNGENLNYGTSIIVAKTKLDTSLLSDENFISEDENYFNSEDFNNDKQYWTEKFKTLPENLFQKLYSSKTTNTSSRKEFIIKIPNS